MVVSVRVRVVAVVVLLLPVRVPLRCCCYCCWLALDKRAASQQKRPATSSDGAGQVPEKQLICGPVVWATPHKRPRLRTQYF